MLCQPYVQFLVDSVIFLLLYQQSKMRETHGGRIQTHFIAQLYFVFRRNKHTWKGGMSAKMFVVVVMVVVVMGFNILGNYFYCEPHSWGLSQDFSVKSLILPSLYFLL